MIARNQVKYFVQSNAVSNFIYLMLAIRFATCIKRSVWVFFARLHHFQKNVSIERKMIANGGGMVSWGLRSSNLSTKYNI